MDAISAVASVIALLSALATSIEAVKEIWAAPQELQQLALELKELNTVSKYLLTLVKHHNFTNDGQKNLRIVHSRLRQAQEVFEERLSKRRSTKGSETRFRRRTWILHHGEIKKLITGIAATKAQLSTTMQLLTLSLVSSMRSIQAQHSQRMMGFQGFLQKMVDQPYKFETESLSNVRSRPAVESDVDESDSDEFFDATSRMSPDPFHCPIGTSSTWYPERWVIEDLFFDRFAMFGRTKVTADDGSLRYKYFFLFAQDSRHWRRVVVWMRVRDAKDESSGRYLSSEIGRRFVLSKTIRLQLTTLLESTEYKDSVTHVHSEFAVSSSGDAALDLERSRISNGTYEISKASTKNLDDIRYSGIRQYVESEVAVLSRIRPSVYIVIVQNQQCLERKVPFQESEQEFFEDMKLLQMAQGCSGVVELFGIVCDDSRSRLLSYIVSLPKGLLLLDLLEMTRENSSLSSRIRRELLIRQIVVMVADVHKKGIVLGSIDQTALWVTSDDRVLITSFKSTASYRRNVSGHLPPEMRQLTKAGDLAVGLCSTLQSDIFQLGMVVCLLANNKGHEIGVFHSICSKFLHLGCPREHINPVELPSNASGIPCYIGEIIRHCRQEVPNNRKSAHELLALLPASESIDTFLPPIEIPSYRAYCPPIICNNCGRQTTEVFYHCRMCEDDNFDICPKCFSAHSRCYDQVHVLEKRIRQKGWFNYKGRC